MALYFGNQSVSLTSVNSGGKRICKRKACAFTQLLSRINIQKALRAFIREQYKTDTIKLA